MRNTVKFGAYHLCRYTGLHWLSRRYFARNHVLVLIYHGVVPVDRPPDRFLYRNTVSKAEFEAQMRVLKRDFHPISAKQLLDHFEQGAALPPRPVLVTFDDGYRNNLIHAAPVLDRLGVPWLVFITTGYVGTKHVLWPDEVNLRVLHWPETRIPLPGPGGTVEEREAGSVSRVELAESIRSSCKRLEASDREKYLNVLRRQRCEAVENPDTEVFSFLDWSEVRTLASMGVEIGSHTVSHPILTRIPMAQVEAELRDSRTALERETGQDCRWFAYPNGQITDFSPEVVHAVSRHYRGAFTATGRYADLGPSADRHTLSRINVPGYQPEVVFENRASGWYGVLSRSPVGRILR